MELTVLEILEDPDAVAETPAAVTDIPVLALTTTLPPDKASPFPILFGVNTVVAMIRQVGCSQELY